MRHFSVGQKVVCVNDEFEPWIFKLFTELPKKGVTYVIRAVTIGMRMVPKKRGKGFDRVGAIRLLLVGLNNPHTQGPAESGLTERGFDSDRFVPLDELNETKRLAKTGALGGSIVGADMIFIPEDGSEPIKIGKVIEIHEA